MTQRLGSPETTAQVHPAKFTEAMMRASGAAVRIGRVTGIARPRRPGLRRRGRRRNDPGRCGGHRDGAMVDPRRRLAALPPVFGLKGHSIVFDTGESVPAEALFAELRRSRRRRCNRRKSSRAPTAPPMSARSPARVRCRSTRRRSARTRARSNAWRRCAGAMSPVLAAAPIIARQACFRPIARDGLPLIGRVPGVEDAYLATGHSVWGILNAPATGEAIAEAITRRRGALGRSPPVRCRPPDAARPRQPARPCPVTAPGMLVIPGEAAGREPGTHIPEGCVRGFRARRCAALRND